MRPLSDYYSPAKDGGLNFTQPFYDLSLKEKNEIVVALEASGLITYDPCEACTECGENNQIECKTVYKSQRTLYRLGSALLQHSTALDKEEAPISGVRTLSRKARDGDNEELPIKLRALMIAYPSGEIPVAFLMTLFGITEDDLIDCDE